MKMSFVGLLAAALAVWAADASAQSNPRPTMKTTSAQSARALVERAKVATAAIWAKAKLEAAMVDEHDVVITFRVSEADTQVRESIRAFIELAELFVEMQQLERHLHVNPGFDCALQKNADMCRLTYSMPMPRPKPNELLPNNKRFPIFVSPTFADAMPPW